MVRDLDVDFLVTLDADRFDVLDLDELADALDAGDITAAQCASTLRNAQRFIDRHLRDPVLEPVDERLGFPPPALEQLASLPPFASP